MSLKPTVLFRLYLTELIKIKSTIALRLSLILPFIAALIYFFIFYFNGDFFLKDQVSPWIKLAAYTLGFWAVFILPLLITIQTSLINEVETRINAWKQLLTIGISRSAIYLIKLFVVLSLVFCSMLLLIIFIFLSGELLTYLRPELGFSNYPIPVSSLIFLLFHLFISSLFIVVAHFFFSIIYNKLFASLAIGISITILNTIVSSTNLAVFFPWSYPALIVGDKLVGNTPGFSGYEVTGIVLSVILTSLSVFYFSRKEYL